MNDLGKHREKNWVGKKLQPPPPSASHPPRPLGTSRCLANLAQQALQLGQPMLGPLAPPTKVPT